MAFMESIFEKYDLVIYDEFGYVTFDKSGAELLFNMNRESYRLKETKKQEALIFLFRGVNLLKRKIKAFLLKKWYKCLFIHKLLD